MHSINHPFQVGSLADYATINKKIVLCLNEIILGLQKSLGILK